MVFLLFQFSLDVQKTDAVSIYIFFDAVLMKNDATLTYIFWYDFLNLFLITFWHTKIWSRLNVSFGNNFDVLFQINFVPPSNILGHDTVFKNIYTSCYLIWPFPLNLQDFLANIFWNVARSSWRRHLFSLSYELIRISVGVFFF